MQRLLFVPALLAMLAGCGTHASPAASALAPQLAHTDGLLGGFSGHVGSQNGQLVLELLHQAPFTASVTLATVYVATDAGPVETELFLGADHRLYGRWARLQGVPQTYALGTYAGTPTAGQPLRYQLLAGARLTFAKDRATLQPSPLPKAEDEAPVLIAG